MKFAYGFCASKLINIQNIKLCKYVFEIHTVWITVKGCLPCFILLLLVVASGMILALPKQWDNMWNATMFYFVAHILLSAISICQAKNAFRAKVMPYQLHGVLNKCETGCANFPNISTYSHLNGCVLQRNPENTCPSSSAGGAICLLVMLTDAGNVAFQESSVRG